MNGIAVIAFTKKGAALARKISGLMGGEAFVFFRYAADGDTKFKSAGTLISELFPVSGALIFIGACGIAVRAVAPHIKSKKTDPAVIVIDEAGRYAIPILSGHLGGANELAERIAEKINAEAVITTATDINGKFAVDEFAAKNDLAVSDFRLAKKISAELLNGGRVGFISDYEFGDIPRELFGDTKCEYGICVSEEDKKPFKYTLNLYPRDLVVGIGCRRGTKDITEAVRECAGDISRVRAVVSVDLKKDERAILNFCRENRIEFITYSAEELMNTEGDFTVSDFVRSVTGADNICERSVVRYGAVLIKKKQIHGGVTTALGKITRNYQEK